MSECVLCVCKCTYLCVEFDFHFNWLLPKQDKTFNYFRNPFIQSAFNRPNSLFHFNCMFILSFIVMHDDRSHRAFGFFSLLFISRVKYIPIIFLYLILNVVVVIVNVIVIVVE